ncbi:MAG: isocitrate lyase/phosphoenolpyruvate mutase family protein, partial [Firmicutes bacterium]|nr:isocitrate lyase/phosphoenolpyruvate mutase family protein [Bacillota bacterium]
DADNGHGNPLNVRRTVREFEAAGVAGVHIEDQVLPKRCGHMEGKQVVSLEEMTAKIRAAVEARRDSDFVIIARTDARATHGLEEAVRRGQACLQAGADVIFVEAPTTMEEMRQIAGSLQAPLFFNWARTGKSPLPPFQEVAALGYKIIAIPLDILYASWFAVREVLAAMAAEGTSAALAARMPTFEEFNRFVGLGEYRELEERYGVAAGFSVKRELGR